MKRIFFILLLLSSILFGEIDERKSDVFFANGIATTEEQAIFIKNKLRDEIEVDYPENYKSIFSWQAPYNHTYGIGIDLYESMMEKRGQVITITTVYRETEVYQKRESRCQDDQGSIWLGIII